MDLNQASVFVKVVETGSFSAAARQLRIPTSTVSHRVAMLERSLGVTLLQRTTRRLHLTEAGNLFFQHALAGIAQLQFAKNQISEVTGEANGRLRVTAPDDLGDFILTDIIERMYKAHPKVQIEFVLTGRYVDLVAEGVDVAIRAGKLKDSTLIAKNVGFARWLAFASPAYLQSAAALETPADLQNHCCAQFTPFGRDSWTLFSATTSQEIAMPGQLLINNIGALRTLALSGVALALLPEYWCLDDVEKQRLVRVLPAWQARTDPIHIAYPRQKFISAKLKVFVEIAADVLSQRLDRK